MERSVGSEETSEADTLNMLNHIHDIVTSSLLSNLKGVKHGYSTKTFGDARKPEHADVFIRSVIGVSMPYIKAQQVHGAEIVEVTADSPHVIEGVDGLVTAQKHLLLEVHVADCVPVLFVDPDTNISAVVHAGWKGTRSHIVSNAVKYMKHLGADVSRIRASIGPHIGGCCYTVPVDRIREFDHAFGRDPKVAYESQGDWHLDLGYANWSELIGVGILPQHIDAPICCTSCQSDIYFSYRKSTKETFGEIIGVIGCT